MSRGGGSLMDIDDLFGEMHCGTFKYTPLAIKLPPPNPRSSSLEVLVAMHWESPLQPKFTTPSSTRTYQLSCFRLPWAFLFLMLLRPRSTTIAGRHFNVQNRDRLGQLIFSLSAMLAYTFLRRLSGPGWRVDKMSRTQFPSWYCEVT